MQVRVDLQAHVEQHRRRNAHVTIARDVAEDRAGDRCCEHQNCRDHQGMHVAAQQRVVNEVL